MPDKQIKFNEQEQMQIESIVIDRDKEEALRFLTKLLEEIKGHPGHVCSPGPIR